MIFLALLKSVPGLEERILNSESEDEVHTIATLVCLRFWVLSTLRSAYLPPHQLQKGASSARSDDTKSLKSAIVDWLTLPGEPLIPPIARNVKSGRGFHHETTGGLLCPAGVDWSDKE